MRLEKASGPFDNFEESPYTGQHLAVKGFHSGGTWQHRAIVSASEGGKVTQQALDISIIPKRIADNVSKPLCHFDMEIEKMTASAKPSSSDMGEYLPRREDIMIEDQDKSVSAVEKEILRSRCTRSGGNQVGFSVCLDHVRLTTKAQEYLFNNYGHGIERLSLKYNRLNWLSPNIKACQSLRYLDLGGNELRSFPSVILDLTELQILDLSDNKLVRIPDRISNLKKLMVFDIKYNDLQTLPRTLTDMVYLEALFISPNPFSDPELKHLGSTIYQRFLQKSVHPISQRFSRLTSAVKRHCRNTAPDSEVNIAPDAILSTAKRTIFGTGVTPLDELFPEKSTGSSNLDIMPMVQKILAGSGFQSDVSSDAAEIISLLSHYSTPSADGSERCMSICSTNSAMSSNISLECDFAPRCIEKRPSIHEPQVPHQKLIALLMADSHDIQLSLDEGKIVDALGYGALHIAAKFGACTEQLVKLMDAVSNINQVSLKGETFLHLLTTSTHPGCGIVNVERILKRAKEKGFLFDLQDLEGYNALLRVILEPKFLTEVAFSTSCLPDCLENLKAEQSCRALTERNCQGMNVIDALRASSFITADLQFFCKYLYQQLVHDRKFTLANTLEESGIFLNSQNTKRHFERDSAVHQLCAWFGNEMRIYYLRDSFEWAFLDVGKEAGDFVSGLETFLGCGIDANEYNNIGVTPLMALIAQGSALGMGLDVTNHGEGREVIKERKKSIETEYVHCIQILVTAGARFYQFDRRGNTLLLQTVLKGFQLGFCVLVELGAKLNIRNKRSTQSALEIAQDIHRCCSMRLAQYERRRSRPRPDGPIETSCLGKPRDMAYAHSLWILTLLVDLGAVADPSLEQELGLGLHDPALRQPPRSRFKRERRAVIPEENEDQESAT
ncbi:MAG: hypothetical protein Q9160_005204 [Pyrenula sp. 1 TL-2023]